MRRPICCNRDCRQGRDCPMRDEQPSRIWAWFLPLWCVGTLVIALVALLGKGSP